MNEIPTPTIEQLRSKNPLFFSKDTMNFFGQTFHMFRLKKSPLGIWFLYAPAYMREPYKDGKKFMQYTLREVNEDLTLSLPLCTHSDKKDLDSVLAYIESN